MRRFLPLLAVVAAAALAIDLAAQAAAAGQAQVDQYKKAFSACMEGKGYTVK